MRDGDADNCAGLGASHQTGWTALVAKLIVQQARWKVQVPTRAADARPASVRRDAE